MFILFFQMLLLVVLYVTIDNTAFFTTDLIVRENFMIGVYSSVVMNIWPYWLQQGQSALVKTFIWGEAETCKYTTSGCLGFSYEFLLIITFSFSTPLSQSKVFPSYCILLLSWLCRNSQGNYGVQVLLR